MWEAARKHWPEYLMEAAGLGCFMVSACVFTVLLFHSASPVARAMPDPLLRRALIGVVMGLTAIALIYSPWGKRSGAHLNPSLTLTFLRLGKVRPWDAAFYILAQFAGGLAGVLMASVTLRDLLGDPIVNYAATLPGPHGIAAAFFGELVISFGLMIMVLHVSNRPHIARFTGCLAGLLVATYIVVEAPLSGMSMNPARTIGSALPAHAWTAIWIYFTAPLLGMLSAAEIYRRTRGTQAVLCAKLHHDNPHRCIFRCTYAPAASPSRGTAPREPAGPQPAVAPSPARSRPV